MRELFPFRHQRRVYCAGPLFNEAERREMVLIADALRLADFDPFVPHADGMEFAQLEPCLVGRGCEPSAAGQVLHQAIFALDVYQVMAGCASLVLNMNGRVPDEGAVAEAAMAWTLGKPIVIFKADARSKIAGRDNPLIVGQTDFETVEKIEWLPERLLARQAEIAFDTDHCVPCPRHLQRTLSAGERLWDRLQDFGGARPSEPLVDLILELFEPSLAPSPPAEVA
ncbi:MAG TPA: nucleoside 2-deoxyribosyltransferase [Pirellulales bacterium]